MPFGYAAWSNRPAAHELLRQKRGQLCIDVDVYHDGLTTLAAAMKAWGPLPDTIWSSNREDGSKIMYFTCPQGLLTVANLDRLFGTGIDLIQRHHRFAVVSGTDLSGRR